MANTGSCVLCDNVILLDDRDSYNKLFKKGVEGLNKASHERGIFNKDLTFEDGLLVHVECQKKNTNPNYIAAVYTKTVDKKPAFPESSLRSKKYKFNAHMWTKNR